MKSAFMSRDVCGLEVVSMTLEKNFCGCKKAALVMGHYSLPRWWDGMGWDAELCHDEDEITAVNEYRE